MIKELIDGIFATIKDVIDCPIYFNHAPQGTAYPFATFNIIDSPRNYSMLDSGIGGLNHTYSNVRVQFSVFGNEKGSNSLQACLDIMDDIETTFAFQKITLATITSICSEINNEKISFYDSGDKIWNVSMDIIFKIGN